MKLKPVFTRMPNWMLFVMLAVFGLPLHILFGVFDGIADGWRNFACEWRTMREWVK